MKRILITTLALFLLLGCGKGDENNKFTIPETTSQADIKTTFNVEINGSSVIYSISTKNTEIVMPSLKYSIVSVDNNKTLLRGSYYITDFIPSQGNWESKFNLPREFNNAKYLLNISLINGENKKYSEKVIFHEGEDILNVDMSYIDNITIVGGIISHNPLTTSPIITLKVDVVGEVVADFYIKEKNLGYIKLNEEEVFLENETYLNFNLTAYEELNESRVKIFAVIENSEEELKEAQKLNGVFFFIKF